MKTPRFLTVFLCSAGVLLAAALLKAFLVSGLHTLPPAKILIFACASFGLVAAAIDWALLRDIVPIRRVSGKRPVSEDDPSAPPRIDSAESLIRFMSHVADENAPSAQADTSLADGAIIDRARKNPIVFREIFPPAATSLSFYGGIPIAPAGFSWPRVRNKREKAPLSFVMQWDCAELARKDATGLLPSDGALYFFCDLAWGDPFDFQFVYAAGPSDHWHEVQVPADLPPVYGEEGVHLVPYCSPRVERRVQDVPSLLPRWPFAPSTFPYPESEDADRRFWHEGDAVAEALLALEHPDEAPPSEPIRKETLPFGRPFPEFPHDWAAVRIVASELLQRLQHPDPSLLRERFEHDRKTALRRWGDGAAELYTSATSRSPAAALDVSASDKIWRRMEEMAPVLERGWGSLVQECINTSLGIRSEASNAIPANLVAECARRHELASVYLRGEPTGSQSQQTQGSSIQVRSIHSPPPNHMFGPPSFVQGHVEEYLDEWVLLLELSSRKVIGHQFGEGVYQFMIRPVHLRERRFDRVKLVASAY